MEPTLVGLDLGEREEVIDRSSHPKRLGEHPLGEALGHARIVLRQERLRQQPERTDRRLELVADVGHEVAPHRLEPAPVRDVVDRDEHTEAHPARRQGDRAEHERAPRRAEQVHGPLQVRRRVGGVGRGRGPGRQLADRLFHQRVAVPCREVGAGHIVGEGDRPGGVVDHDALWQRGQGLAEPTTGGGGSLGATPARSVACSTAPTAPPSPIAVDGLPSRAAASRSRRTYARSRTTIASSAADSTTQATASVATVSAPRRRGGRVRR